MLQANVTLTKYGVRRGDYCPSFTGGVFKKHFKAAAVLLLGGQTYGSRIVMVGDGGGVHLGFLN